MNSFLGSSESCINSPFMVSVALPSSYYYSSSQPPPMGYYVKGKNRWVMFSMDLLNGQYAQTLVCNFETTSGQTQRELLIFGVGILSTLSITFGIEAWTTYEKRNEERNKDHE